MAGDRPVRFGLNYHGASEKTQKSEVTRLILSRAGSLADAAREFSLFTLGAIYCRVPLGSRDLLADGLLTTRCQDLFSLELGQIFDGLDIGNDPTWNHVLFAVAKPDWPRWLTWLGSLSFGQLREKPDMVRGAPRIQHLLRIRSQQVQIFDVLKLDRLAVLPHVLPRVEVTAFVIDGSRGCWYFDPAVAELTRRPALVYSPRRYADTVRLAEQLSSGNTTPLGASAATMERELGLRLERVKAKRRRTRAEWTPDELQTEPLFLPEEGLAPDHETR